MSLRAKGHFWPPPLRLASPHLDPPRGPTAGSPRPEEFARGGVREPETFPGEPKPVRLDNAPALLLHPSHFAGPFFAKIEAGGLEEGRVRPPCIHAQSEGGRLAGPRQRGQLFERLHRPPPLFELPAVEIRVGPVLRPDTVDESGGAGAQAMEAAPPPGVDVVRAGT